MDDLLEIPPLETERLRLRAFKKSDINDYTALNADPEVLRYLGCGPEPSSKLTEPRRGGACARHAPWFGLPTQTDSAKG